jgi:DNA polymerase III epsilon subunit-like protein
VWTDAVVWLNALRVNTLVAHNASAEAIHLVASLGRYRVQSTELTIHCTLRWIRAIRKSSNTAWKRGLPAKGDSLTVLAAKLNLGPTSHRALVDAVAAYRLAEWVLDRIGASSPAVADAILDTEPYLIPARSTWAHLQLVDPKLLTLGQMHVTAEDHRRAKRRGWPAALIEESWGPQRTPNAKTLNKIGAAPRAHALRTTTKVRLPAAPPADTTRDVVFRGIVSSSRADQHLHDIIVSDIGLLFKAAGHQVRGEAAIDVPDGKRPDLLTRLPQFGNAEPWWPFEFERKGANSGKRGIRIRDYFDRTRLPIDELDAIGIAEPVASISWPGFASLVNCDVAAERSRPARAFVDHALTGPEFDLVHVVQGYLEGDLVEQHTVARRDHLTRSLHSTMGALIDDLDVNQAALTPADINAISVATARMRRDATEPLVRDLSAVARLVRPSGPGTDGGSRPESWADTQIRKALDAAYELDHRIIDEQRDKGERAIAGKPFAGGGVRTNHGTVLLTGELGDELAVPVHTVWGSSFHRHQLTLSVPNWTGVGGPVQHLDTAVVLTDAPHRRPGRRIWGRGVVVAATGSLSDEIFGRDALTRAASIHERVTIVLGWTGPIAPRVS